MIARNFLMIDMLDHFSARDRSDWKFKMKNCAWDRSDRTIQCSKCSRSMFLPLGLNSNRWVLFFFFCFSCTAMTIKDLGASTIYYWQYAAIFRQIASHWDWRAILHTYAHTEDFMVGKHTLFSASYNSSFYSNNNISWCNRHINIFCFWNELSGANSLEIWPTKI